MYYMADCKRAPWNAARRPEDPEYTGAEDEP